ncbi:hypothetical protein LEP1GSC125_3922 [Leptospira mayottensis 200901122]|uniref:Uncharacterized protein n=1 Tax=Leptospira mayottensis 200901122 TaxID=1193010 RepID=A0AA87T056_9LEPT|nr:hypothetical protein LEP1GSC125_3922 [Leptospira mayottensis 200901122]
MGNTIPFVLRNKILRCRFESDLFFFTDELAIDSSSYFVTLGIQWVIR